MCGFVGIIRPPGEGISLDVLTAMRDIVSYRGPDDAGWTLLDSRSGSHLVAEPVARGAYNVGLGFRRLSILDLSHNGAQPMASADGSAWLVFNGEVYNYVELRAQLINKDRPFKSNSDTEVILALYEERGIDFIHALNGMFALAIWDQHQQRLVLARDRLGIKPLYYTVVGSTLYFASEMKSLLMSPEVKAGLDPRAVMESLTFQFPLEDRTLYKNIFLLEPGTTLEWHANAARVSRYWQLAFRPEPRKAEKIGQELLGVLDSAIIRQLRSDVPIGTYLSGGIDTGTVSTLAIPHCPSLQSFTCGFDVSGMEGDEQFFDERPQARQLASALGLRHHELEVKPQDLERLLPWVMWHLEEPRAGISYQIFAMAKLVRRHVTVVLSGVGGDEMFGGYPWRYRRYLEQLDDAHPDEAYYREWCRLVSHHERDDIFHPDVVCAASDGTPDYGFKKVMEECESADPLDRAFYFDAKSFLHALLLVEDRLTMAHSLETRVPLIDNDVIDLIQKIPSRLKFDGQNPKVILRKALRGSVSDDVLDRRKQGFTPPDRSWYQRHMWTYIESTLLSDQFLDRGLFRPEGIAKILDEHKFGRVNRRFLIWSLLGLEWTNRLFVDQETPVPPDLDGLGMAVDSGG